MDARPPLGTGQSQPGSARRNQNASDRSRTGAGGGQSQPGSARRNQNASHRVKARLATLAAAQFGRVSWRQLRALGAGRATINRWVSDGYLHPVLPGVYAVGHRGGSTEGELSAALLLAGPGAALSHATAAWWWGLLEHQPIPIQVVTPRRIESRNGIRVYGRRFVGRTTHRNLPVTTPAQALFDFALTAEKPRLRLALANADFHRRLDLITLDRLARSGRPGGPALRAALRSHLPELARTHSEGERRLLGLCESHNLPLPQVNVRVGGWPVDAVRAERKLVVEVDGLGNHRSPAQLERDHRRDFDLRAAGFTVLRYTVRQLREAPDAVAAELRRLLAELELAA